MKFAKFLGLVTPSFVAPAPVKEKPEVKLDKIGRVLMDAADYIEKNGWTQGVELREDGRACAMGAISAVIPDHTWFWQTKEPRRLRQGARRRLEIYLSDTRQCYGIMVESWNDWPTRTKKDVINSIRAAATFKDG